MANKLIKMINIKQILRRLHQGESCNSIAEDLRVHKRSIRSYRRLFEVEGYSIEQALLMPETELTVLINARKPRSTPHTGKRYAVLESRFDYYCGQLKRTGVTLQLLWEEYRAEHTQGYGYSQFAHHVGQYRNRHKLSMHLQHIPGEVLQLDFAGDKLSYIDEQTGELIACEVLVCTLPFSGYSLAIALPSQKQTDFVSGIN